MRSTALLILLPFLAACSTASVDMAEPRRILGTAEDVRVDAEIRTEEVKPGDAVPITWEITNGRREEIAVADIVPEVSFESESRTITVALGSEVPGASLLPRLIVIRPGEKKAFRTTAKMNMLIPRATADPRASGAVTLQVKVNYLTDIEPFRELTLITEKAVNDPKRADELFPLWLERNRAIVTNALPLRWVPARVRTPDGML